MNAELGTSYDVEKMVGWTFEVGDIRNWGAIVGTWGGVSANGLIGEARNENYAFALNGFQQAAALVPLVRYDSRLARAVGRWMTNLASASRRFYGPYLPDANQTDDDWLEANDPLGVVAYEGLRRREGGESPVATGDAKRNGWAPTNLGLYGSSSVGYLAAVVDSTEVPGVLRLDLNATDFFAGPAYRSVLVYNPHDEDETVTVPLAFGTYDVYDAVAGDFLARGVRQSASVTVPADAARVLVFPARRRDGDARRWKTPHQRRRRGLRRRRAGRPPPPRPRPRRGGHDDLARAGDRALVHGRRRRGRRERRVVGPVRHAGGGRGHGDVLLGRGGHGARDLHRDRRRGADGRRRARRARRRQPGPARRDGHGLARRGGRGRADRARVRRQRPGGRAAGVLLGRRGRRRRGRGRRGGVPRPQHAGPLPRDVHGDGPGRRCRQRRGVCDRRPARPGPGPRRGRDGREPVRERRRGFGRRPPRPAATARPAAPSGSTGSTTPSASRTARR